MARTILRSWECVWVVLPLLVGFLLAGSLSPRPELLAAGTSKTAPPPKFDKSVLEAFVPDVRKTVGPGEPGPAVITPVPGVPGVPGAPGAPSTGGPGGSGPWATIISSNSIESEIKFQQKNLAETAKTLNGFKSGGNVKARDSALMMAALFAVIQKYDGEVKWKKDAEGMQQGMMQAGNNCKTSSDNAYKEVVTRLDQLKELMNGQASGLPKLDPEATWGQHITVNPLMKRLELAEKEHFAAWTGDAAAVNKHKEELIQEGEVLAFIGQFIVDSSFDSAGEADYKGWAASLSKGGHELAEAAKAGDQAKAIAAVGVIKKTCTDCHGAYR